MGEVSPHLAHGPSSPALTWAASGLMALTGPAGGAPVLPRKNYLARLNALLRHVENLAQRWGTPIALDHTLFVERAAILGLTRRGQVSANGTCRLVRAQNGWLAVNLARPDDLDLLPAWLGIEPGDDPWATLSTVAAKRSAKLLADWGATLGLAVAALCETPCPPNTREWGIGFTRKSGPKPTSRPPRVIDLSSLWAGPLCGHLLGRTGARVIKVESTHRPDGARSGAPAFYNTLHAGQQAVSLDFKSQRGKQQLRQLIGKADIVIESTRPRALQQLGIHAEAVLADKPGMTWVSITAYGRHGEDANRVGFGDDTAAAAGLVAHDAEGRPVFLGDAIADPIAGLAATAGTLQSLLNGGGYLVDISLARSAAAVAAAPTMSRSQELKIHRENNAWLVRTGDAVVAVDAPAARHFEGNAPAPGHDTASVLREFCR